MVEIDVIYEGEMHCAATHGPSKRTLATDAPVDNHGRGESFSPTDLVATGLGTCMATVMGILARSKNWDLAGSRLHVEKEMTTTKPRRIARLPVRVEMAPGTANLDAEARAALEHAANTCPVRLSIHEAIDVPIEFVWPKGR
jgi:putative redox protein